MSDEIKILLTSDLHIGSDSPVPKAARIKTFRKIAALAASHDILIIAGDLFDSADPSAGDLAVIKHEIESLSAKGVATVFNPGRYDLDESGELKKPASELPFTKIFSPHETGGPWLYEKNSSAVYLYGMPYSDDSSAVPAGRTSDPGFHIGVFYCDFEDGAGSEKKSGYLLKKGDLRNLNLDFYTLGSCHDFRMFKIGTRIVGAYPGSPEAASPDETGDRFALSFHVASSELCQIKRLSVNSLKIILEEIDCSAGATRESIFKFIEDSRSKRVILRLRLNGMRDFNLLSNEVLSYAGGFAGLHFEDMSEPTLMNSIQSLGNEDSLKGEFFKVISEQLASEPGIKDDGTIRALLKIMIDSDISVMEGILCGSTDV